VARPHQFQGRRQSRGRIWEEDASWLLRHEVHTKVYPSPEGNVLEDAISEVIPFEAVARSAQLDAIPFGKGSAEHNSGQSTREFTLNELRLAAKPVTDATLDESTSHECGATRNIHIQDAAIEEAIFVR
jgi:hypothetical protein